MKPIYQAICKGYNSIYADRRGPDFILYIIELYI